MPTISIDTFFACTLMVLIVVSAMAVTSRMTYPYINYETDQNAARRFREISSYLLLNEGRPSNWGQSNRTVPEALGLAKSYSEAHYLLDIDKISRLNQKNLYAIGYAQAFTAFGIPDVSFRVEMKPVFEVVVNLTRTFNLANDTTYQFEILTRKHGSFFQANLRCYIVADKYLNSTSAKYSEGMVSQNVTLPNSVKGPALLVVFAKSVHDDKLVSFSAYACSHNSAKTMPSYTFLNLSPINHKLNASFFFSGISLSEMYALTFHYNSTLTEISHSNISAVYSIPYLLDVSPTVLVATGTNSSDFFTEWVAYPQIPLKIGTDFENSASLGRIFTYAYMITIDSVCYECTVLLRGLKE